MLVGDLKATDKIYNRYGFLSDIITISDPQLATIYQITGDNGKVELMGANQQVEVFINNIDKHVYTIDQLYKSPIDAAWIMSQNPCDYQDNHNDNFDPKQAAMHARQLPAGITDCNQIHELTRSLPARQYFISGLMGNTNYYHNDKFHFTRDQDNVRDQVVLLIESVGLMTVVDQQQDCSTVAISWQPRMLIKSIDALPDQYCRTIEIRDFY